jgi:hypothetical protein
MQIGSCMVLLGGDMLNQTPKFGVTPAEVVILKALHGDEAVTKVEMTGSDRRPHADEYARLNGFYGAATGEDRKSIFRTLYPNPHAPLPGTFKEIGVDVMEDEPAPRKRVEKSEPAVKTPGTNFLAVAQAPESEGSGEAEELTPAQLAGDE